MKKIAAAATNATDGAYLFRIFAVKICENSYFKSIRVVGGDPATHRGAEVGVHHAAILNRSFINRNPRYGSSQTMLIRPELIDRLADTIEGIAIAGTAAAKDGAAEASILIYHAGRSEAGNGPVAGESPLLEINLRESEDDFVLVVSGALGIVEMHGVEEIRLLDATEEAAFYSRESQGKISVITLSSHGVIQAYLNVAESLIDMDFADVPDDDLRTAVALKIFAENGEVFRRED